jgi:hypothetical protein
MFPKAYRIQYEAPQIVDTPDLFLVIGVWYGSIHPINCLLYVIGLLLIECHPLHQVKETSKEGNVIYLLLGQVWTLAAQHERLATDIKDAL